MDLHKNKMNLELAAATFYALEDIKSRKYPNGASRLQKNTIDKLQDEVAYFQGFIAERMAKTMFDYLALASLGEARHAQENSQAQHILEDYAGKGRSEIYHHSIDYDPVEFLQELRILFDDEDWNDGYGGSSWARVCKRALAYFDISPIRFVDSAINICHNNGIVYNKGMLIGTPREEFIEFLDFRSEQSFLDNEFDYQLGIYGDCYKFIERAIKLNLIGGEGISKIFIDNNLNFPFVTWGNQSLTWVERSYEGAEEDEEEEGKMVRLSRPWRKE